MPQTTRLAAGTTGGTSADITVAAGATVKIGIFAANGTSLPADVRATVISDTPGAPAVHTVLDKDNPVLLFEGPATYNVVVPPTVTAVGAFEET